MNLRWIVGNYADPEFRLTRSQQREVTRLAHRNHLAGATLWIWTLGMTLSGWLVVALGTRPLAASFMAMGLGRVSAFIASLLALCAATCVAAAWLYRYIYVRPVRQAMRELGYDVCVGCGYRLQGLPSTTQQCPECGHSREPLPRKPVTDATDS